MIKPHDWMHDAWTPPASWFQSRAYWRAAADRVASRPDLVAKAIVDVDEILSRPVRDHGHRYYEAWRDILRQGPEAIAEILRAPDDDRSQVLRSMCPIHGLLSQEERMHIFRQVAEELQNRQVESH